MEDKSLQFQAVAGEWDTAGESSGRIADTRGAASDATHGQVLHNGSSPAASNNGVPKATHQHGESPRQLTEIAETFAAADQPYKALQHYQRALQAQREQGGEEMPDAHVGVGDLCRTFAMSAAAVRSYERAVRLRPRRPYYRWKLAVALAALGLYEQAVAQLLAAIEMAPRDTYYRFQLADIYLLMRRDEDAITALREVVGLAPRDDYYHLRLGAALLRAERANEAVLHFERAVQLKPGNSSYRALLRYAYNRNQQEPMIAVDIEMIELDAYDEDFVRRIRCLSQPLV
jgi:tetratricopeptide (TPR) repeat protein